MALVDAGTRGPMSPGRPGDPGTPALGRPDWLDRSWARCQARGFDRRDSVCFEPVAASRMREIAEASRRHVEAARPALDLLARAVAPADHVVFATDRSGAVIAAIGDIDRQGPIVRSGARIGVDLSEIAVGTTSIGGVLHECRTVEIHGTQHFFDQLGVCNCAAAPVFDPQGGLIAVVDVTSDSSGAWPQLGRMVEATARDIQNRLFALCPSAMRLRLNWNPNRLGGPDDALVGLDADGRVIAANQAAHELCAALVRCDGSLSAEQLLGQRIDWLHDALARSDRRVAIRLPNGLGVTAMVDPAAPVGPKRVGMRPGRSPADQVGGEAGGVVFGDSRLAASFAIARRAFDRRLPILLAGETGTGKEVTARALHGSSRRQAGPFIALNCASIPAGLIESELFGYADGAFTGARRGGARGKLEAANGGTLFLDEIGDMPLELQARLLRVLEERQVVRLGETGTRATDFALICASHRDLRQCVAEGRFREDLYFRIRGFPLLLPPLRERDQADALFDVVLQSESSDAGESAPELTPAARTALRHYRWPGNIRELRYALRFALALNEARPTLDVDGLPADVRAGCSPLAADARELDEARSPIDALTDRLIRDTIDQCGGNISAAARRLGIGRATVYRRLRGR